MVSQGAPAFTLYDRTVVVTGAGRGLGRAMGLACASAGAIVVGIARSEEELQGTGELVRSAGAGKFAPLPRDLAHVQDFDGLVGEIEESAGPIFGVVHAAGVQVRKPALEVDREDWRRVLDLNLAVPFFLSTAIGRRQMADARPGSHVLVGSLGSSIGLPRCSPYCVSKAGVLGVVRSLAVEWAQRGVRVNAIGPGYYETALTADLLADPDRREQVRSRIPMGRLGDPGELGGAAVFLLSDASGYVTGQVLNVDGGWLSA